MELNNLNQTNDSQMQADQESLSPDSAQLDSQSRPAEEPTLPNSTVDPNGFSQFDQTPQPLPNDLNPAPDFDFSNGQAQQTPRLDVIVPRIIAIVMICAVGYGIVSYQLSSKKSETKSSSVADKEVPAAAQPTTSTSAVTKEVPAADQTKNEGLINLSEVGCQSNNLFVMSTISGKIPVDKYGNYAASFSPEGAQLVFLMDDKNAICASSISLPENQGKVKFDANSTAEASIFQTIGILSTDPIEAKQRLAMIGNLASYPAFYSYVKQNLPDSSMAELVKDPDFVSLETECIKEIAQKLGKQ